jgi:hypothetical protein
MAELQRVLAIEADTYVRASCSDDAQPAAPCERKRDEELPAAARAMDGPPHYGQNDAPDPIAQPPLDPLG